MITSNTSLQHLRCYMLTVIHQQWRHQDLLRGGAKLEIR